MRTNKINNNQPAFGKFKMTLTNTGRTGWFENCADKITEIVLKNHNLSTERIINRNYDSKPFIIKDIDYIIKYEGKSRHKDKIENDLIVHLKNWAQRKGFKANVTHIEKDGYNSQN